MVAGVVLALVTYAISIITGIIAIMFTPFRDILSSVTGHLRPGAFLILDWPVLITANLLFFCYSFIAIFILCFWLAARNENGVIWGLRSIRQGSRPVGLPNWLAIMPLITCSLLLIVLVVTVSLSFGGVRSGNLPQPCPTDQAGDCLRLPSDVARLFAGIIYAPISEEMAFRITVLGVLVGFRMIWNSAKIPRPLSRNVLLAGKGFLFALYSPERAKALMGLPRVASSGWRGVHWTEWTLLILTSILFGLAHILYGAGWEAGKVLTAGLSGFALGLVYLTYGFFANVLVHWFFNFYLYIFTLEIYSSVVEIYSGALLTFALTMDLIVFLLTLFLGVLGIIVGVVWYRDRSWPRPRPTAYSTAPLPP